MNPYIIIAIMLVIDVITLPLIIKKMLKKATENKGLKVTLLIVAFVVIEAVFAFVYISSAEEKAFYDRQGNRYSSSESVVYYDKMSNEYLLCETADGKMYFISGRIMNEADSMYIDKDGYLIYDSRGLFEDTDSDGIYKDKESNEYYRADEVRWDKDGQIHLIEK